MASENELSKEALLRLLDSPGIKHELSRTITNTDKAFDDSRPYPQERVDAVTEAFMQALKKAKAR